MEFEDTSLEVDAATLEIVYRATLPIYYRIESLLRDLYQEAIHLSETDTAVLLEFAACASTSKILLEEFLESYPRTEDQEKVIVPRQEFATIMSLSKTVELSTRTAFSGFSIQEH